MTHKNIYKFEGNLEGAFNRIAANNWIIAAGSTSNCCDHYNIAGVAETINGHVTLILGSKYSGFKFVTPCDFTEVNGDLLCLGNYGTPTRGTTYEDGIISFNEMYSEANCDWEFCQIRPISKIMWKDGTTWTAA